MYSHEHKFIYVHIPKSAGTYIKHYLLSNIEENYAQNTNQASYHEKYRTTCERSLSAIIQEVPDWKKYFKFTVVRNPFDRVVSMFSYLGGWKYDYFTKNNIDSPMMPHVEVFRGFYLNNDFDGFIKEAYQEQRIRKFHAGYYENYLDRVSISGKPVLDAHYKMESMEDALFDLQERLNLPYGEAFDDWRQNSSAEYKKKAHYSEYYSSFSRNYIENHFKRDLEYFDYGF